MNLIDATASLKYYMDNDIPAFMWGAPGVGKSDTVRAAAKDYGGGFIDFRCTTRDPVSVMGLPDIEHETTRWKVPNEFPQVERDGETGTIFLDELNAAAASMQTAMFGFVLDRFVGDYHLPPGWRIVAAGNRQSDRAAAQRMPSALANRFAHIDVEPDVDAFRAWAVKAQIDPMVIAFLQWKPSLLHNMEGDLRTFPTPRQWAQVAKIANAPDNLLLSLVTGLVGEGPAGEFVGFKRIIKDLPSLDYVLSHPHSCDIPQETSAKHALTIGLAMRITTDAMFKAGLDYVKRLPAEFAVLFVNDVVSRDHALSHSQTYVEFMTENADIAFA